MKEKCEKCNSKKYINKLLVNNELCFLCDDCAPVTKINR